MTDGRPGAAAALEEDFGRLLTPAEASAIAGIGTKSLAARADRGTLPCFRALERGHRRYREADIRAIAPGPGLMTPAEAAGLLRVAAKTVMDWAREGRVRSVIAAGGQRMVSRAEITAIARGELNGAAK